MAEGLQTIGKSVIRKDSVEKVTGAAIFACDKDFPDQVYGAVKRSIYPFARIKSIHVQAAQNMPGVACVITAKDIPGENRCGIIIKDEFVLAEDIVRRIGDPIAIVAARSAEAAQAAVEKIEVEYEPLRPVLSLEEAMAADAPKVHEKGNLLLHKHLEHGNVEEGLENSYVVVENEYRTSRLSHMFLEPEAGAAKLENGILTIWCCTQNPHFVRNEVARVLGLSYNNVRVVQTVTGGGFGGKLDVSFQCMLALVAFHTSLPVKIEYSRAESTLSSSKRHPFIMRARTGADKQGKLIACEVNMLSDGGAYASYAPAVASRAIMHFMGPYNVPNVRGDLKIYYSNNPTCGAFRGFGMPQVAICHEGQMNALARALGMDPIEIRLLNAHRLGDVTVTGQTLSDSVGFVDTLIKARKKAEEVLPEL